MNLEYFLLTETPEKKLRVERSQACW